MIAQRRGAPTPGLVATATMVLVFGLLLDLIVLMLTVPATAEAAPPRRALFELHPFVALATVAVLPWLRKSRAAWFVALGLAAVPFLAVATVLALP